MIAWELGIPSRPQDHCCRVGGPPSGLPKPHLGPGSGALSVGPAVGLLRPHSGELQGSLGWRTDTPCGPGHEAGGHGTMLVGGCSSWSWLSGSQRALAVVSHSYRPRVVATAHRSPALGQGRLGNQPCAEWLRRGGLSMERTPRATGGIRPCRAEGRRGPVGRDHLGWPISV